VVQVGVGEGDAFGRAPPRTNTAVVLVVAELWPTSGLGPPSSPPELVGLGDGVGDGVGLGVGLGVGDGVGLGVVSGVVLGLGVAVPP